VKQRHRWGDQARLRWIQLLVRHNDPGARNAGKGGLFRICGRGVRLDSDDSSRHIRSGIVRGSDDH
jgi:hypothetical protein